MSLFHIFLILLLCRILQGRQKQLSEKAPVFVFYNLKHCILPLNMQGNENDPLHPKFPLDFHQVTISITVSILQIYTLQYMYFKVNLH